MFFKIEGIQSVLFLVKNMEFFQYYRGNLLLQISNFHYFSNYVTIQ